MSKRRDTIHNDDQWNRVNCYLILAKNLLIRHERNNLVNKCSNSSNKSGDEPVVQ